MDGKLNSNMLLIVVLILGVGIFAAYRYKKGQMQNDPIMYQQSPQQWDNWTPGPNSGPSVQPPSTQPSLPPAQPQVQPRSYEEAVQAAKSQNKKLFVYFEADWCSWCKKMKSETLSDGKVKAALSSYIVYYVDTGRERAVANKYNVSGIPAYFIVDGSEQKEKNGNGFKSVDQFLSWLGVSQPSSPQDRRFLPFRNPKN